MFCLPSLPQVLSATRGERDTDRYITLQCDTDAASLLFFLPWPQVLPGGGGERDDQLLRRLGCALLLAWLPLPPLPSLLLLCASPHHRATASPRMPCTACAPTLLLPKLSCALPGLLITCSLCRLVWSADAASPPFQAGLHILRPSPLPDSPATHPPPSPSPHPALQAATSCAPTRLPSGMRSRTGLTRASRSWACRCAALLATGTSAEHAACLAFCQVEMTGLTLDQ